MKEEKKESKLPSPMAILSGKSDSKKDKGKSDKKPKPKYRQTMITHHDDGTQTANMEPGEGGKPVSFSRPGLKEMLSAIEERHNAPEEPAEAPTSLIQ